MTVNSIIQAPTIISLPIDIYDELREKAKKYDEIVNMKSLTKCPVKEQIFDITSNIVCNAYDQEWEFVMSKTRKPAPTKARAIIMYCLSELGFYQQEIAEYLNRSNHTSVHHHVYEVKGQMDVYPNYKREVTNIFNKVKLAVNQLQKLI